MIYINSRVYNEIMYTIGNAPIESGGILGMKDGEICAFYFDKGASTSYDAYIPNIKVLNEVIKRWSKRGIRFFGIVHSHANGYDKPSYNDEVYARNLLEQNPSLRSLVFPILTNYNGEKKLSCYEYITDFTRKEIIIK